ncbi:MAG: glycosyltransferase family 1 protein [Chloroflexi bacterium]|nr:MAG: glycosyltransferase family 1 protein [Chloroflexota bacterium]
MKPRLLWVGDAVAHTGFATVTHAVLDHLRHTWDVHVLGINYRGDPHPYPYPIWPASRGMFDDDYGVQRFSDIVRRVQPHVVCILNDPWVVIRYVQAVQQYRKEHSVALCAYVPVDGLNIDRRFTTDLNAFDAVITYTDFGYTVLQRGGFTKEKHVIPHGIDTALFTPVDRVRARQTIGLDPSWFIVGVVNRNQPRKRLDLTFEYFAAWAADKPDTVKLYYHGAVVDVGWDIVAMADYYGIQDRLILTSLHLTPAQGIDRDKLCYVYSSFDVQFSTTMGEGWGLTTMEGMACGVPQIVPEWAALAEWPRGAVYYVPCTMQLMHTGGINTVGGIADRAMSIQALDAFYHDPALRESYASAGLALVRHHKYRWSTIAAQFSSVFTRYMPRY